MTEKEDTYSFKNLVTCVFLVLIILIALIGLFMAFTQSASAQQRQSNACEITRDSHECYSQRQRAKVDKDALCRVELTVLRVPQDKISRKNPCWQLRGIELRLSLGDAGDDAKSFFDGFRDGDKYKDKSD